VLHDLTDRWRHTVGVAARAAEVAGTVPAYADRHLLVAAAWLHDIGYAQSLHQTGFHPLDGALYLQRAGWPARLAALVAHHSGARFVARARGLSGPLARFECEESAVSDALTYADQTTGPAGRRLPIDERMAESLHRHGSDSPQAAVCHVRGPYLLAAAGRVERRRAG
jgi:putative nucleotidyltransferase with HDIG domain